MTRAGTGLIASLGCLVLSLYSHAHAAGPDPGQQTRLIQQRLTLASHMIQRIGTQVDGALADELEALQGRFLLDGDKTLAADADAFFKKVMAVYRAQAAVQRPADTSAEAERYRGRLAELQSFHQSYEALVAERGEQIRAVLDEARLDARVRAARELAAKGDFSGAYALADGAYHQLIVALTTLRDKETVEYRLEFASEQDEYDYEIRRFQSQKMLLEMTIAESPPSAESLAQIRARVAAADAGHREARGLADAGRFAEAVDRQEDANQQLTMAMRSAGLYF